MLASIIAVLTLFSPAILLVGLLIWIIKTRKRREALDVSLGGVRPAASKAKKLVSGIIALAAFCLVAYLSRPIILIIGAVGLGLINIHVSEHGEAFGDLVALSKILPLGFGAAAARGIYRALV
jgi:hypothetical protein